MVLLLAWQAAAQVTTASVSGRVVDANGPVEGVTVVAVHQQTNVQYYATSGRGGWYQLLDVLPGGPYTLRIHYFGYEPLTVRGLYTYAGQNTVVDADLEAGSFQVRTDEASTSLRIGEGLGGGAVPVSPTGYELISQQIYTAVPFDVRQEASLSGFSRLRVTPGGSRQFRSSAYGYYGGRDVAGLILSTPLAGDDYRLFAGLQYDGIDGFGGAGRFDARFSESLRFDAEGGRLSASDGWASAGLTARFRDGLASNRTQAGWYGDPALRQWVVSDDLTLAAGRQRFLIGGQFTGGLFSAAAPVPDSSFTRFDVYVQDVVRLGRRLTMLAGIRFSMPFSFSPRVSLYYDVTGTGAVVLRAGTAVYGRPGEGSVWKNLAAVDTRLPLDFRLTLESVYGQTWRRAFYVSSYNILASHYELTARVERPFSDNLWAVASYTRSDGGAADRFAGGFSYRAEYLEHYATTLAFLYTHGLENAIEARISQDLRFSALGRGHAFRLTGYLRRTAGVTALLFGLNYHL